MFADSSDATVPYYTTVALAYPEGEVRGFQTPHWIFRIVVNCVFAKVY